MLNSSHQVALEQLQSRFIRAFKGDITITIEVILLSGLTSLTPFFFKNSKAAAR